MKTSEQAVEHGAMVCYFASFMQSIEFTAGKSRSDPLPSFKNHLSATFH